MVHVISQNLEFKVPWMKNEIVKLLWPLDKLK